MFNQFLSFLTEALRIISVQNTPKVGAPFGRENRECLDLVLAKCAELGFATHCGDGYYGYADLGGSGSAATRGEASEPFYILGHLDVVPVGDGWTKDPGGEVADGKVYGRGVMDDKGPMLACLFAAAELFKKLGEPKRPLRLVFGCNEESGWGCMDRYISDNGVPGEGFSPDGDFPVINCEKGMVYYECAVPLPDEIEHMFGGYRPNMVMDACTVVYKDGRKTEVFGKSAHGSRPELGDNAFIKLIRALDFDVFRNLYAVLCDYHGRGAGLEFEDKKSGKLTLNIGRAWTERGELVFTLDIRYPVDLDKTVILAALENALPFARFKETGGHKSLYFPSDAPLVKKLLSAYRRVTNKRGAPIAVGGGTYARAMARGVAFGPELPGASSTIHQKDECADLNDLRTVYDIYLEAIRSFCY